MLSAEEYNKIPCLIEEFSRKEGKSLFLEDLCHVIDNLFFKNDLKKNSITTRSTLKHYIDPNVIECLLTLLNLKFFIKNYSKSENE